MVAPLVPYGVKGAIWYQGESNASRAYQYRKIFPGMIADWRALWGEETLGVEWRTRIGLRHRLFEDSKRPTALSYNLAVNGVTRPEQWVRNYRGSILVRRQIYRDFLFFEVEPSLNYRRRKYEDDRDCCVGTESGLLRNVRYVRKKCPIFGAKTMT